MKKDNIQESGTGYYKAIQERRPHAAMELIAKALNLTQEERLMFQYGTFRWSINT